MEREARAKKEFEVRKKKKNPGNTDSKLDFPLGSMKNPKLESYSSFFSFKDRYNYFRIDHFITLIPGWTTKITNCLSDETLNRGPL